MANQTLGGEQLTAKITECIDAGPCRFYLVAPCPRRRTAGVGRGPSCDLPGLGGNLGDLSLAASLPCVDDEHGGWLEDGTPRLADGQLLDVSVVV